MINGLVDSCVAATNSMFIYGSKVVSAAWLQVQADCRLPFSVEKFTHHSNHHYQSVER